MIRRPTVLLSGLLAVCAWTAGAAIDPVIPGQAQPFPLPEVRLLAGPFHDAMLRDEHYLLSLDVDRLLLNFRVNAGLPATAKPYGGWEAPDCELRGHCVGHYLSACSLMYASTGDAKFKERVDALVAGLAQCQAALAKTSSHPGYLSAFPESFIDRVENRQPVWAPWYTLHKIMAGLLDAYQLTGNAQALAVDAQMAGWVQWRVDHLSEEKMQASLQTEQGGMNEVLANLYAITGNPDTLRVSQAFNQHKLFVPLAQEKDVLDHIHANTQIPKIIGAARQYELTGNPDDATIAKFFWDRVALHRSYVIGDHSEREYFFPTNDFAKHLTAETCETCNTYNMLKLTRHLFAWQPDAALMDFYERALYNDILASQDPEDGMFTYFMSLKPGHFKTYSRPESSFWCCVGTGMENHAKYGDTIYFHDDHSLWVNLFIPSELAWSEKHLVVRQETKVPVKGATRLVFTPQQPVTLAVKIRWPAWAERFSVRINGHREPVAGTPGSYVTLDREWHAGDRVDIDLPLTLHTEPLPGNPDQLAILDGPIVLAGQLGTVGIPDQHSDNQVAYVQVPDPAVPVLLTTPETVLTALHATGTPLTFRTQNIGQPKDVTLVPFYLTPHERYNIYWHIVRPENGHPAPAASLKTSARNRFLLSFN